MRSVKLYDRKTPITAADLLNDRVVPFFDVGGARDVPGFHNPRKGLDFVSRFRART
ncbi:MAG: hypothetical protein ACXW34_12115 [Nitrospira sp.]